jgi:hypothetical protein
MLKKVLVLIGAMLGCLVLIPASPAAAITNGADLYR